MRKVTVTLPETAVQAVRGLVERGTAASVSAFVQHAVAIALDDVDGWHHAMHEALEATGGPLTESERAWADEALDGRATTARGAA